MTKSTKIVEDIADKTKQLGDNCFLKYNKSKNLNTAKVAISAYRSCLYAHSLLIKLDEK